MTRSPASTNSEPSACGAATPMQLPIAAPICSGISLCGTISSGLVTCDSSGTRFECVKEECCPLTGQKIKGRDELVIENNDRIVLNFYKTLNDREVKVGELVSIRQK